MLFFTPTGRLRVGLLRLHPTDLAAIGDPLPAATVLPARVRSGLAPRSLGQGLQPAAPVQQHPGAT